MTSNDSSNKIKGVKILTPIDNTFEKLYLKIRKQEGRILSDEEVVSLPSANPSHRHYEEWLLRSKTSKRISSYLKGKPRIEKVLDVGCGNGWFTNIVCESLLNCKSIIGVDVNVLELKQGCRLFTDDRIQFVYADLFNSGVLFEDSFDLIVLNASLQYFRFSKILMNLLKGLLRGKGEIHILDSPIYQEKELSAARERSLAHYEHLGYPEMAQFYFHHTSENLNEFEFMYKPKSYLFNKILGRSDSPFPWLRYIHNI